MTVLRVTKTSKHVQDGRAENSRGDCKRKEQDLIPEGSVVNKERDAGAEKKDEQARAISLALGGTESTPGSRTMRVGHPLGDGPGSGNKCSRSRPGRLGIYP